MLGERRRVGRHRQSRQAEQVPPRPNQPADQMPLRQPEAAVTSVARRPTPLAVPRPVASRDPVARRAPEAPQRPRPVASRQLEARRRASVRRPRAVRPRKAARRLPAEQPAAENLPRVEAQRAPQRVASLLPVAPPRAEQPRVAASVRRRVHPRVNPRDMGKQPRVAARPLTRTRRACPPCRV